MLARDLLALSGGMVQFLCAYRRIECPACGLALTVISEQDERVAQMRHGAALCNISNRVYRVDRETGYAEVMHEA